MSAENPEESLLSDSEFAGELALAVPSAVQQFGSRYASVVNEAWKNFRRLVSGCLLDQTKVISFVGGASGRGYIRYCVQKNLDVRLDGYVEGLELTDLTLAGACIDEDGASLEHLNALVETRVLPTLVSLWRRGTLQGTSKTIVEDTGGSLIGHLWVRNASNEIRLATYLGRCRLTSWMIGIARHAIIDEGRKLKRMQSADGDAEDGSRTIDLANTIKAAEDNDSDLERDELIQKYRVPLLNAVLSVEGSLTPRQKAVFRGRFLAGIAANELADCLQISRPRISQLTTAIQQRVNEAVRPIAESLAEDMEISADVVLNCLQDLQGFIESCSEVRREQEPHGGTLVDIIQGIRDRPVS